MHSRGIEQLMLLHSFFPSLSLFPLVSVCCAAIIKRWRRYTVVKKKRTGNVQNTCLMLQEYLHWRWQKCTSSRHVQCYKYTKCSRAYKDAFHPIYKRAHKKLLNISKIKANFLRHSTVNGFHFMFSSKHYIEHHFGIEKLRWKFMFMSWAAIANNILIEIREWGRWEKKA